VSISKGPALMCPHVRVRNSTNVTLIAIDLNSKIMLDAKNSSLIVHIIAVPCNRGLLILKANPIMDLGDSCYLCCYIFQIFFLQGSLALQFTKAQNKASDIRFKRDSHISTAAPLKDS